MNSGVARAIIGQKYISRLLLLIDSSELSEKYTELASIFVMMIAFLFAVVADLIGLSAIVGAFVAGVALEGVELKHSRDFKEGAEYVRMLIARHTTANP